MLGVLKLYLKVGSFQLPALQKHRALKLYYKVASSNRPARHTLPVLKLYYKVANSHLLRVCENGRALKVAMRKHSHVHQLWSHSCTHCIRITGLYALRRSRSDSVTNPLQGSAGGSLLFLKNAYLSIKPILVCKSSVLRSFNSCPSTTHHTPVIIHHSSHTTHHTLLIRPLSIHYSSNTTHQTPLRHHLWFQQLKLQATPAPGADCVAGAALCEAPCANFVAGMEVHRVLHLPRNLHFKK